MLTLPLDVTDKAAVDAAVAPAHEHFGRLDVVVNNAGYGLFGMIEEVSEEQARAQIETNLFGALWVTQAALPILREQGSGPHHPGVLDRRRQRVPEHRPLPRVQVGPRGLQPGARTGGRAVRRPRDARRADRLHDRLGRAVVGHRRPAARLRRGARALAPRRAQRRANRGDPEATGPAILELVDADEPPLRVFFGAGTLEMIHAEYERRLENWERWDDLANRAHGQVAA